jgi:molecular chaperone DnaK
MGNIAGIDLGTTFSNLAVLNSMGRPETVPDADGERLTPSAIYLDEYERGKVLVGREALNARLMNASRSVRWIKRHMQDPAHRVTMDGRQWSPAELSSLILRKLREECCRQVGEIRDAVITVPAHFDEVGRKATMDAGKMAGLNVVGIVNEPTAAAVFYAVTHEVAGRILVFDLGGGTFDVTVADVQGHDVKVICSQGDHRLGGYDLDQKLLGLMETAYRNGRGGALHSNAERRAHFEDEAEDIKKTLSKRTQARRGLTGDNGDFTYEITREEFEEAISPFVARVEMLVETALEEAGRGPSGVDRVLLVGGSTRIPLVTRRLEKMFGFPPTAAVNVDECVALGAALWAGLRLLADAPARVSPGVAAGLSDVTKREVCNQAYGTICLNADDETGQLKDVNDVVIAKNTPIPCEVTKTYYTVSDGQEAVNADVTEGESGDPHYVKMRAQGILRLPPNRPAGRPIKVTYRYDLDQRMHCVFEDVETGRRYEMDIDAQAGGVSQEEVAERRAALEDFTVE